MQITQHAVNYGAGEGTANAETTDWKQHKPAPDTYAGCALPRNPYLPPGHVLRSGVAVLNQRPLRVSLGCPKTTTLCIIQV